MTTNETTTQRVKLKRVGALRRDDVIVPGKGIFDREGNRVVPQSVVSAAWGNDSYTVTGMPWMNDVPEMNVPVVMTEYRAVDPESILHTPVDAFVVLVPGEEVN